MANEQSEVFETIAKTHFASHEAHPLGAIFWACKLYLTLFWLLANPLGMFLLFINEELL